MASSLRKRLEAARSGAGLLGAGLVGLALSSCDRTGDYAMCGASENPAVGSQTDKCPPSIFELGVTPWRDLNGVLWRGENGVSGAVVSIASTRTGTLATTVSTTNGFFGPVGDIALRYDLTTKMNQDVLSVIGLATRYPAPSIDVEPRRLTESYTKRIDVHVDVPLPADHAIALFTSGGTAYSITGDIENGAALVDTQYAATATVHAIEYEKGKDLSTAVAYGKADVFASFGTPALVKLRLEPIKEFRETKISLTLPAGLVADTAEVELSYTRSSVGPLTKMTFGKVTRLPLIPGASYAYRIHATSADGATADSGQKPLDALLPEAKAELFLPPVPATPDDGATISAGTHLRARGEGVIEHVLVAESGGQTIHVVTRLNEVPLPDFASVGAPLPKGRYSWIVRSFPKMPFVDSLSGPDGRRFEAVSTSRPRTVVFAQ